MRPEIHTLGMATGEPGAPSALSDVIDNAAMGIDPYELTEVVRGAAKRGLSNEQEGGGFGMGEGWKAFWKGVWDDMLGGSAGGERGGLARA
jgi:hypothetical protein